MLHTLLESSPRAGAATTTEVPPWHPTPALASVPGGLTLGIGSPHASSAGTLSRRCETERQHVEAGGGDSDLCSAWRRPRGEVEEVHAGKPRRSAPPTAVFVSGLAASGKSSCLARFAACAAALEDGAVVVDADDLRGFHGGFMEQLRLGVGQHKVRSTHGHEKREVVVGGGWGGGGGGLTSGAISALGPVSFES